MPTANPKQAARARAGSRIRFSRYFSQVCKQAAKATGTVYHGSDERGADYDTKTKPLSTVADMNDLLNLNGAKPLDEATIRACRKDLARCVNDRDALEAKRAGRGNG